MDAEDVAALLSPTGQELLRALPPYDPGSALAQGERLRAAGHPAALVAAALTQARLRERARPKLGERAAGLLLTPDGVEQATRALVAERHARRYAAAGLRHVADLGCGIGADALALLDAGLGVTAVDADPVTAAVAAANLAGHPGARVRCADVTAPGVVADAVGADGGAWFDPARRSGGRRVFDPESTSPPLSFVLDVAARVAATGAKLAPGVPHDALPPEVAGRGTEAQWTSVDGDVVECALWCGPLARPGVRRGAALAVTGPDGASTWHEVDDTAPSTTGVGAVGEVLYEPDGAVIRAGLVGAVAAEVGGRLLDPTIAYVTADGAVPTPLARGYAVEHVMPFGLKPLRAWLRAHGVGRLVVKKRGTAVEPEVLRRQLRLEGTAEATVVLTRVAGRQSVLVVRPLPSRTARGGRAALEG
ncbi:hypothetical protein CLV92_103121 [Kineococcus xinjiangensis]|uniref:THUMP-like domain-containing protein n=1 Tax=Kineococcus xinjiangensis TaxID=512762 RepID=A0A2S6ITK9_9ACTN|nr:SAM-dependent methyltransferase [Kineococcus xinjiangensis]PPK97587.1 hypothetical protein CLV92_103121 [Kineococcus xinjiangensis]